MSDPSDSDSDESLVDAAGAILPIQQQDVHKIVSGQVISDMSSAVKELVDNALDAGATSINIRLFNQGLEVIEVSDDGSGVPKHSRPLLAMKHATSKIVSFDDLYKDILVNGQIQPNQLGFRGEALFSLAQISQDLIVCTRTEDEQMAQQLRFTRDGYLDPSMVKETARKVGTTVAVVKLFAKLPVRRQDMIKRVKAQRAKLLKLLQAYAVLCVGVRFNVYDITGAVGSSNSKTELRMSTTEKSKNIKETISSIFGSQFLSGLCMLRIDLFPLVYKALRGRVDEARLNETRNIWRIEGMVSTAPNSSQKKSAREVQFFSINGRPVEMPKLSRFFGEVWRNFELVEGSKKRPACILGIYLPNSMFDVNISPDKREVFLTNDSEMYDLFRNKLHELWSSQTGGTFAANLVEKESNIGEKRPCPIIQTKIECKKRLVEQPTNEAQEHSESPNTERRPPQRRMKRRNAFVRSFDNVGSYTTDDYVGCPGDSFRHESNHLPNNLASGNSANGHPKFEEHKNERITSTRDDVMFLWKQTRLNFNSSQSDSQLEDIHKLKSLQSKNDNATKLTPVTTTIVSGEETKNDSVDKTADQNGVDHPGDDEICSRKKKSETEIFVDNFPSHSKADSAIADSAFNTNSNPSQGDSEEEISSISKRKSHYPSHQLEKPSNSTSTNASKLGGNADVGSIENGSDTNDKVSSPRENPYTALKKRKLTDSKITSQLKAPLIVSSPDSTSSSSHKKDGNDDEEPSGGTVWHAFQNTANVVELASTAHSQIMNRRKKLKEIKMYRKESNQNDKQGSGHENLSSQKGDVVRLSKDDFLTMTVLGQFNHGFILTLCDKGQLWILDQHACDEKYNFEKLCRETKIHEQKLIKPLPLELSPSEENCILSHMEIFEANGFRFHYDQTKPPRNRLSLTALPHSGSGGDGRKAVQFGKEDVGALCAILGADGASSNALAGSGIGADGGGSTKGNNAVRLHAGSSVGNGAIIRLPKSVAMFASRACRRSIMIGEPLSEKKMKEVVRRLRDVDQPWSCPHGRPTIRHIKDLLDDLITDEKMSSKVVAGDLAALSQEDLSQGDE